MFDSEVLVHLSGKMSGPMVQSRNIKNSSLGRGQPLGFMKNIRLFN